MSEEVMTNELPSPDEWIDVMAALDKEIAEFRRLREKVSREGTRGEQPPDAKAP